MFFCRLIYMLSILCVRLTINVKVGIPESFKVGWYPPQKNWSSHLKAQAKTWILQMHFEFAYFYFVLFGIETLNTFIPVRSRSFPKNYTRFQTKMGKVFLDQKGPKILPFGAAHTYMAYKREYPPGPKLLSWKKMGVKKNIAFLSGSWFSDPGSTPPPRISRSIYNLNSHVLLFGDLLILFFLT